MGAACQDGETRDRVPVRSLIASVKRDIRISLVRLKVLFEVSAAWLPHHGVGYAQPTNVVFAVTGRVRHSHSWDRSRLRHCPDRTITLMSA